ncbi:MAG: HD domain-containing protein [Clostridiaceae bacterium]|nr:HD domain-containing protein [Clostridiaceae bacterium]
MKFFALSRPTEKLKPGSGGDSMLLSQVRIKRKGLIIVSYILSTIVFAIVYFTGGTHKVYTNLMYIPISVISSTNGIKSAVVHAIYSGLLVGPIMPMNVEAGRQQDFFNWFIRLVMYVVIAAVIGFFADYYRKEFEVNKKKEKELADAQYSMVYSLVKLAESRDDNTGAHIERVALFCRIIAEKLRDNPKYKGYIDDSYIENLYKAAPLHDIGKVGIPDQILLKPGKLNQEEYEIMKNHAVIGANTLKEVIRKYPDNRLLEIGISITNYHHERWDGKGYPEGLKVTDIPLSARIMAVADVYDALRSVRVYKRAFSHEEAVNIIKEGRGTQFDPDIVDVFLENHAEFDYVFSNTMASGDIALQVS